MGYDGQPADCHHPATPAHQIFSLSTDVGLLRLISAEQGWGEQNWRKSDINREDRLNGRSKVEEKRQGCCAIVMGDRDTLIHLFAGGVGGTAGAIITCPLEVVKTRLQGSNSGFDTRLKPPPSAGEGKKPGEVQCKATKWTGKAVHQSVYRPALGSQYSVNVQLLKANRHFGSVMPILYSTQSQPCRPLQSKLSAFHDRCTAKVHTGHSITAQTKVRPTVGVWACLCHIVEHEGPRGLFRGLVPNLVGVAPSRAIYFWSYSTAKKTVNQNLPRQNRDSICPCFVCSLSRLREFMRHQPHLVDQDPVAA